MDAIGGYPASIVVGFVVALVSMLSCDFEDGAGAWEGFNLILARMDPPAFGCVAVELSIEPFENGVGAFVAMGGYPLLADEGLG